MPKKLKIISKAVVIILILTPLVFVSALYYFGKTGKLSPNLSKIYSSLFGCNGVFGYTSATCEKLADAPSASASSTATRGACNTSLNGGWLTSSGICSNELVCTFYNGKTLMWPKSADNPGTYNGGYLDWSPAFNYCNGLTWLGYSDWRLPTKDELLDLCSKKDELNLGYKYALIGGSAGDYWSSTHYSGSKYYGVKFNDCGLINDYEWYDSYVRCVRP
ncbi:DUF1566 domain-containing protein [bacterium]|nr:DUF1566 domain-containing protein [bacterium]